MSTVDIMLPYYGDVGLMKLAVQSVMWQTDQDWRLTVIDDGYPDESVAPWFAALGDHRVRYLRNEHNLGANGNYRKCLTLVEHELAVIMGADDVMLPNYVDWLRRADAAFPQADIFQPGVVVVDERGAAANGLVERAKRFYAPGGTGMRTLTGEALAVSVLRGDWLYFPSLAWRSGRMLSTGFREHLDVVQDLALVLDIAKAGGTLVVDDEVVFHYRRHSASDSSWRALEGTRFEEEHRFLLDVAGEMRDLGWRRAARVARLHVSSRGNAATVLVRAALARNWKGVASLARRVAT